MYLGEKPIIWAQVKLGSWRVNHDSHIREVSIPLETGHTLTLDWSDRSHSDNYERGKDILPFVENPLTAEMFILNRKGIPVSWFSWATVEFVDVTLMNLISYGSLPSWP